MKKLLLLALVTVGLQAQAQINPCDSVSYTITPGASTPLLELEGIISGIAPASIVASWDWNVCDDQACYTSSSNPASFTQFNTADSLKACYNVVIDIGGMTYSCSQCDSLVFGPNGWMLMNMGSPSAIQEKVVKQINNNKIYDLLGREWTCSFANLPKGIYIINNRKILKTK